MAAFPGTHGAFWNLQKVTAAMSDPAVISPGKLAKLENDGKQPRPAAGRDALPDYAERVRRMSDLINAPALPIADLALFLDLPLSTIDKLRMQGRGPKCFKLGRRLYVRQADLRAWLDVMAESEAA